MKRYLIITFTLLTYFSIQSQVHFATTYGKSDIGWNFRIGLEYFPLKNLSIGVGTRIISLLDIDKFDSNVYKDKFYPLSNKEHFGLYLSLNYYILKNNDYFLQPFLSYDFSYSRAHLRWYKYFQLADNNGAPINRYERKEIFFNPLNAFEHHLAFGLDIKLYKGLILTEKIGFGVAHFSGFDFNQSHILLATSSDDKYEFSWLFFNIGLKYDFSNLIKKKKEKAPNKSYK